MAPSAEDVGAIRELLRSQQLQIDGLREQIRERDRRAQPAAGVQAAGQPQAPSAAGPQGQLGAEQMPGKTPTAAEPGSPIAIHYKGITLTPGGFVAGETMWRSHTEQNDIISNFTAIPYNGDPRTKLTEFRGSARQSRISLLADGKVGNAVISGYWEVDFLGAAQTGNENQATGFQGRQRQLFAQAAFDTGWTLTVGQTWTLITMNRQGIETRREWSTATIDGQYVVGYNFARLYTARLTKSFANHAGAFAVSAENPAFLVGGSVPKNMAGMPTVSGVPGGALSTGFGSLGNGNNYTTGFAPDVIAKLALDPGWGHYEVKGVVRFFRDHTLDGHDHKTVGGGVGGGAILPLVKSKLDFVAQGLYGYGTARYNDSGNADLVIRPNGSLRLIRSGAALGGLETHLHPKLDVYAYAGLEYQRRTYGAQNGVQYGYGNPNTDLSKCAANEANFACSADFKYLGQVAPGFWFRPYKGDYGILQFGMQYSYTKKIAWAGSNGAAGSPSLSPKGEEHMAFTSFRYYIP